MISDPLAVTWNVRLRVEILVRVEFIDVDRAHETEAKRFVDPYGNFVGREEVKLGRLIQTVNELLHVLVHVGGDQLAESVAAQFSTHIHEAPETATTDLVFLGDIAIIGNDAACSQELAGVLVEEDERLVDANIGEVRRGIVM